MIYYDWLIDSPIDWLFDCLKCHFQLIEKVFKVIEETNAY